MLVVSSRPWGASYQLLCRLISMHSILNWAIWINIQCPALLIPYWNRSRQALLNAALWPVCPCSSYSANSNQLPFQINRVMIFSGSLPFSTCALFLSLRGLATSAVMLNKLCDTALYSSQPYLCCGHFCYELLWMETYFFSSLGCLATLDVCFLVCWSYRQHQRCAVLHALLNILGSDILLASTALAIWICVSLYCFFIKLGFQPGNEQGRINELSSVCHSLFQADNAIIRFLIKIVNVFSRGMGPHPDLYFAKEFREFGGIFGTHYCTWQG